ncbi:hypothetical protein ACS7ZQ_001122 [Enterococcus faecalis]|uniref:hypothetical protein n=1 Tax=Enterococcus faecalis TaxID=1351 RepID=UPI000353276E|nr:hypothetical protein [Enterococcus faecalis]EGO9257510.1 hypothetical protein [Enterococcus faecalis]EHZ0459600.1 hypothetical protein [Enterococcus faecalis]EIR3705538.1 hypothetical protein [Enterococcus faecalis]EJI7153831.1 hypothetical protein [Enterococcus faecalis]EKL7554301.1 hypothetical protein [Enterococcus faecalis]
MCLFSDEDRKKAQQLLLKYYRADLLRSTFGSLDKTAQHQKEAQLILAAQDNDLQSRVLALTDFQLKDELTRAKIHPFGQDMDNLD